MTATNLETSAAADLAIDRVLKAEQEAREAVGGCEQAARELAARVRARVQEIGARAEARCARLKSGLAARAAETVARLDAGAPLHEPPSAPDAKERERLEAAVAALAAELTGESP
ncbi:MAG: hypothetical protein FJY54_18535 [Betaproteobacteria bacterium]|nr:hypothetical protein [Betaproteobacteria bacterium]